MATTYYTSMPTVAVVNDLWFDTSQTPTLLKICTNTSPVTFSLITVGTSVAVSGGITSSGGGIGYAAGAGGTVTQLTSRTTGVTLSKLSGNITMFSAVVAAAGSSSFVLTNTFIAATDMVIVRHPSATNACAWQIETIPAAGTCTIVVKNISAASITEATPLQFMVLKGTTT